jgi:hypothetical protein
VTIPSTRWSASTTGTALIRCWVSRLAISLNGVDGSAVTTSVVITSRTRLPVMGSSSFDRAPARRTSMAIARQRLCKVYLNLMDNR